MKPLEIPMWKKSEFTIRGGFENVYFDIAGIRFFSTGLGYLGVDLVIDKNEGPLLLELNARPGLQIQIANRKGLLERLEMIDRAPTEIFASPEKRVTWSIQNFAEPNS
jgi:hypothetical protein